MTPDRVRGDDWCGCSTRSCDNPHPVALSLVFPNYKLSARTWSGVQPVAPPGRIMCATSSQPHSSQPS